LFDIEYYYGLYGGTLIDDEFPVKIIGEEGGEIDDNFFIVIEADNIIRERIERGEEIDLPEDFNIMLADQEKDYPPDVWAEAIIRVQDLQEAFEQDTSGTNDDLSISIIARTIVSERKSNDEEVNMPLGGALYLAYEKSDFPEEIWSEAETRWNEMSEHEQEEIFNDWMIANENEIWITYVADEIIDERETKGEAIDYPPGFSPGVGTTESDYPPDVWSEAESRWNEMSESDKENLKNNSGFDDLLSEMGGSSGKFSLFLTTFVMIDLLFIGLAVVASYKTASRKEKDKEKKVSII